MTTKTPQKSATRRQDAVATIWGAAEATVFFIIPDVFTSYRALTSWRAGLRACLFALAGAIAGGCLMYALATQSPAKALAVVDAVPGITAATIQLARANYADSGALAILYGPAKAVPYKIYTVMAPQQGIGFLQFLLISVPARLARFLLVTFITAGISYALRNLFSLRSRYYILAAIWIIVYILYFSHHWI